MPSLSVKSVLALSVMVPDTLGSGIVLIDPVSEPLLSTIEPFGLLNVLMRLVSVGPGALISSTAPVAPGTFVASQLMSRVDPNGKRKLCCPGLTSPCTLTTGALARAVDVSARRKIANGELTDPRVSGLVARLTIVTPYKPVPCKEETGIVTVPFVALSGCEYSMCRIGKLSKENRPGSVTISCGFGKFTTLVRS